MLVHLKKVEGYNSRNVVTIVIIKNINLSTSVYKHWTLIIIILITPTSRQEKKKTLDDA